MTWRPLLALALLASLLTVPLVGAQGGDQVLLIDVEGVVTRGTALHIQQGIEAAGERGVPVVIQLDTPGGLVDATLEIFRTIERADVPVLTFVGPRGGFAASAGTFMLLMGHPSGMAPNTQIGSAQPIQQDPSGGTTNASSKTVNFLVQRMEDIANRTGRNSTLATQFITENLNMDEDRALETGMIDAVAPDVESFLQAVDGMEAIVGSGTVTLDTADAQVVPFEKSLVVKTTELIGNPQIAFILFLVGLYALIFGLANPGTYVPETIGAVLLLLALIGLGLFDTNTAGLLLVGLAAILFIAEVFTPTHGVLTAAGVVSLVLGGIFLINEPLLPASFLRQFFIVTVISALVSGGAVIGAISIALRAQKRPVFGTIVGDRGVVTARLHPEGKVRVRGELWKAVTHGEDEPIEEGAEVEVVARDGLTLTVRAVGPSQDAASSPDADR